MDRKLVSTEKASSDLEAIVRYIARRDSNVAVLLYVVLSLNDHPQLSSVCLTNVTSSGVRRDAE
jgi:plasmid stabilization system protein ParE